MDIEGAIPDPEDYQAYLETNDHLGAAVEETQPPQTSTRGDSTAVAATNKALAAINAPKLGEKLVYQQIAERYGIDRMTLTRRHNQIQMALETRDGNEHFASSIRRGQPPQRGQPRRRGQPSQRGQDEMRYFVSVLAKQVIERYLVEPLPDIIMLPSIIHQLINEEVGYITEEP